MRCFWPIGRSPTPKPASGTPPTRAGSIRLTRNTTSGTRPSHEGMTGRQRRADLEPSAESWGKASVETPSSLLHSHDAARGAYDGSGGRKLPPTPPRRTGANRGASGSRVVKAHRGKRWPYRSTGRQRRCSRPFGCRLRLAGGSKGGWVDPDAVRGCAEHPDRRRLLVPTIPSDDSSPGSPPGIYQASTPALFMSGERRSQPAMAPRNGWSATVPRGRSRPSGVNTFTLMTEGRWFKSNPQPLRIIPVQRRFLPLGGGAFWRV